MGNLLVKINIPTPEAIGYRVGYRIKNSGNPYTIYNTSVVTSPIVVPNVDSTLIYDCYLQTICSQSRETTQVPFTVYPKSLLVEREFYGLGWYDYISQTEVFLSLLAPNGCIGISENKMIFNTNPNNSGSIVGNIKIYDITSFDPFIYTLNKTITNSVFLAAICIKTNGDILVLGSQGVSNQGLPNNRKVMLLDTSGTAASYTALTTLPDDLNNRTSLIHNATTDNYIVTTNAYGIREYTSSGVLVASSSGLGDTAFGGFDGKLYSMNHAGDVFEVKQSGQVLVKANNYYKQQYGATQLYKYSNNFNISA